MGDNKLGNNKSTKQLDEYKPKAFFRFANLYCKCGQILMYRDTYVECCNPGCSLYQKKFKIPSVELEPL